MATDNRLDIYNKYREASGRNISFDDFNAGMQDPEMRRKVLNYTKNRLGNFGYEIGDVDKAFTIAEQKQAQAAQSAANATDSVMPNSVDTMTTPVANAVDSAGIQQGDTANPVDVTTGATQMADGGKQNHIPDPVKFWENGSDVATGKVPNYVEQDLGVARRDSRLQASDEEINDKIRAFNEQSRNYNDAYRGAKSASATDEEWQANKKTLYDTYTKKKEFLDKFSGLWDWDGTPKMISNDGKGAEKYKAASPQTLEIANRLRRAYADEIVRNNKVMDLSDDELADLTAFMGDKDREYRENAFNEAKKKIKPKSKRSFWEKFSDATLATEGIPSAEEQQLHNARLNAEVSKTEFSKTYDTLAAEKFRRDKSNISTSLRNGRADIDYVKQHGTDNGNISSAEKYYNEIEEMLNAPDRFIEANNSLDDFAKGMLAGVNDRDQIPVVGDVVKQVRLKRVGDVVNKFNENGMASLSQDEKVLLGSYLDYLTALEQVGSNASRAFNNGVSAGESAIFMAEMVAFSGATKLGTRGINALGKLLETRGFTRAANAAMKVANQSAKMFGEVEVGGKRVGGLLRGERVGGTLLGANRTTAGYVANRMAGGTLQALASPDSWAKVREGKVMAALEGRDWTIKDFASVMLDQTFEYGSEVAFDPITNALVPKWLNGIFKHKFIKPVGRLINGLPQEMLEEEINNGLGLGKSIIFGDQEGIEAAKQFYTATGQIDMLVSFAPTMMIGGGVNAAASKINEIRFRNAKDALRQELRMGMSGEAAENVLNVMGNAQNYEEFNKWQTKAASYLYSDMLRRGMEPKEAKDKTQKLLNRYSSAYGRFNESIQQTLDDYLKMSPEELSTMRDTAIGIISDAAKEGIDGSVIDEVCKQYGISRNDYEEYWKKVATNELKEEDLDEDMIKAGAAVSQRVFEEAVTKQLKAEAEAQARRESNTNGRRQVVDVNGKKGFVKNGDVNADETIVIQYVGEEEYHQVGTNEVVVLDDQPIGEYLDGVNEEIDMERSEITSHPINSVVSLPNSEYKRGVVVGYGADGVRVIVKSKDGFTPITISYDDIKGEESVPVYTGSQFGKYEVLKKNDDEGTVTFFDGEKEQTMNMLDFLELVDGEEQSIAGDGFNNKGRSAEPVENADNTDIKVGMQWGDIKVSAINGNMVTITDGTQEQEMTIAALKDMLTMQGIDVASGVVEGENSNEGEGEAPVKSAEEENRADNTESADDENNNENALPSEGNNVPLQSGANEGAETGPSAPTAPSVPSNPTGGTNKPTGGVGSSNGGPSAPSTPPVKAGNKLNTLEEAIIFANSKWGEGSKKATLFINSWKITHKSDSNNFEGDDFFSDNTSPKDWKPIEDDISADKEYEVDKVVELFDKYNTDKEQKELAKKVFDLANKLGFKIKFNQTNLGFGVGGRQDGDVISYSRITTLDKNKEKLPNILLHEMIHGVTTYCIDAYNNGELKDKNLIEAVEQILDVYDIVKKDKMLSGEYGLKNAKELIAEVANPSFRDKLKKIGIWEYLKNAIKKLFSFSKSNTTAYDVLSNALDKIIDNYDNVLFENYNRTRTINEEDWNFYKFGENITEDEQRDLYLNAMEFAPDFVTDGDVKFKDFFSTMVNMLGDNIRPFTKEIYLGISAKVDDDILDQMDDVKTVRQFDITKPINTEENENEGENDGADIQATETGDVSTTDNPEEGIPTEEGGVSDTNGGSTGPDTDAGGNENAPTVNGGQSRSGGGSSTSAGTNTGSRTGTGGGRRGGTRVRGGSTNDEGTSGEGSPTNPPSDGGTSVGLTEEEIIAQEEAEEEARNAKIKAENEANEKEGYEDESKVISVIDDIDSLKERKNKHKKELISLQESEQREESSIRRTINRLKGRIRAINEKLRKIFSSQKKKTDLGVEKLPYVSKSDPEGNRSVGSVIPSGVADDIRAAFDKLEKEEGKDIATFVKDELGYESEEEMFCDYANNKDTGLSGEQVDGVGLAIHQMKNKGMFIIGDMTGIGKGRQGAALIRWAKKHGKKVLFVTEKPNLFTDMYGDLKDIGSNDLLPFVIGSNADSNIVDRSNVVEKEKDGKKTYSPKVVVKRPSAEVYKTTFSSDSDVLPIDKKTGKQYDFVMTTYSQAGSDSESAKAKLNWIKQYAKDAIVILDESHNASGESKQGTFFKSIVENAEGVTFMSATYAKRPDNMLLYAMRSSMSKMNLSNKDLIEAVQDYGIPMQEIIASNLFKTGEMIRRERDFVGVKTTWTDPKELYAAEEYDKARETSDKTMEVVNQIIEFQKNYIDKIIHKLNQEHAEDNKKVQENGDGVVIRFTNTSYSSQVSNIMNLIMYDLKARKAAELAIQQIKEGKKPVIAVENTFGSYIDELEGELDDINFTEVLKKGLLSTLKFKEVRQTWKNGKPVPNEEGGRVTIDHDARDEVDYSGMPAYMYDEVEKEIEKYKNDKSIEKMSLSPIDYIKELISDAGYKCGEITGRNFELQRKADGGYKKVARKSNRQAEQLKFNGGTVDNPLPENERTDCMILNVAGATGISLHASARFGDQKQRTMLILQPARNVSIEVQMRGRVDRTGQVSRAEYYYIISPIPTEQKQAMMLRKKLASLDANTVGTEDVSSNKVDAEDMDNKYGDKVAEEYLKEHLNDINTQLGDHGLLWDKTEGEWMGRDGLLYDVLIGIQRLACEEQEKILEELQALYKERVEYLVQNGIYDLSSSVMNLDATTIDSGIFLKGNDNEGPSMFTHDTNIERVEVNVLKKPLTSSDIHKQMKKIGGINEDGSVNLGYPGDLSRIIENEVEDIYEKKKQKYIADKKELMDKMRAKLPKTEENESEESITMRLENTPEVMEFNTKRLNELKLLKDLNEKKLDSIQFGVENLQQGRVYLVPLTDEIGGDAPMTYARFIGISHKEGKPFQTKAVFAVKDARQKIEIPLASQANTITFIIGSTRGDKTYGINEIPNVDLSKKVNDNMAAYDEWWDKQIPKDVSRQIRYMVTENIVQACGHLGQYKGRIVIYSKKDADTGEITNERGMLLAEDFDPEDFKVRRRPTKEDVWDSESPIKDSINNISCYRRDNYAEFKFEKKSDNENLSKHKILKDEDFARLLFEPMRPSKYSLHAYVAEENLEAALDYLYKNYGFCKEEEFVMPDSSERVDKIVPAGKSYKDVIKELGDKYQITSEYQVKLELRKLLKRQKLDINNDYLKEKIKELVQLRQAFYRRSQSAKSVEMLAWGALEYADRYEKATEKEDREDNYNQMLAAIEELNYRGIKGHNWHMEQGNIEVTKIRELFNNSNRSQQKKELADRVFNILDKLNMTIAMDERMDAELGGHAVGKFIGYNWRYMNSTLVTDKMKSSTILHEALHTVTSYLMQIKERGMEHLLGEEMIETADNIENIFAVIRGNDAFVNREDNLTYRDYGVTNSHEMLAEAGSNELFQEHLKKVRLIVKNKMGLITFAIKTQDNQGGKEISAYDAVMDCLNTMIDNFDQNAFKEYWAGTKYGDYNYTDNYRNEKIKILEQSIKDNSSDKQFVEIVTKELNKLKREKEQIKEQIDEFDTTIAEDREVYSIGGEVINENDMNVLKNIDKEKPRYRSKKEFENETVLDFILRYREWRDNWADEYKRLTGEEIPEMPVYKKDGKMTLSEYLEAYSQYISGMDQIKATAAWNELAQEYGNSASTFIRQHFDSLKRLEDFFTVAKQMGAKSEGIDANEDMFLNQSRAIEAKKQWDKDYRKPMLDSIAKMQLALEKSGWDWSYVWAFVDSNGKKRKDIREGKKLTPYEMIRIYVQAKDIQESLLGGKDRGSVGFKKQVGVSHAEFIKEFEKHVDKELIDELWKSIRNATKASLDYMVDSGRMTKEYRNSLLTDRDFYVPERGWAYDEAMDDSRFSSPFEESKGRISLAGDPFSYIDEIAATSILMSEMNKPLQKIYKFISDNKEMLYQANKAKVWKLWQVRKFDEEGNLIDVELRTTGLTEEEKAHDKEIKKEIDELESKKKALKAEKDAAEALAIQDNTDEYDSRINALGKEISNIIAQQKKLESKMYRINTLKNDLYQKDEIAAMIASGDFSQLSDAQWRQLLGRKDVNTDLIKETQNHLVSVVVGGEKYIMWFEEPRIATLLKGKMEGSWWQTRIDNRADLLRKLRDEEKLKKDYNTLERASLKAQEAITSDKAVRFLSQLKTQFSWAFAYSNGIRDAFFALTINTMEKGPAFAAKVTANGFKMLPVIAQYLASPNAFENNKSENAEILREFLKEGAETGYSFMETIKERSRNMDKDLKILKRLAEIEEKAKEKGWSEDDKRKQIQEIFVKVWGNKTDNLKEFLSYMSSLSEMGTRVGQYKTVREEGGTPQEAALAAKEATVNFNRRGDWASSLGKYFMFYNATLQGTYRIIESVTKVWGNKKERNKRIRRLIAAKAIYAMIGMVCRLLQPDDPDENRWIPDWVWQSNLHIGGWLIPMPHFFRADIYLGSCVADAIMGKKSVGEAIFDGVTFGMEELVPSVWQISQSLSWDNKKKAKGSLPIAFDWKMLARNGSPSEIQPIVDLCVNRNYLGRNIYKTNYNGGDVNDTQMHYNDVPSFFVEACNTIQDVTGEMVAKATGTQYTGHDNKAETKGADINPSIPYYLLKTYGAGVAEVIFQFGMIPYMLMKDEEINTRDIPFVSRIKANNDIDRYFTTMYWDVNLMADEYRSYYNKMTPEQKWRERQSDAWKAYVEWNKYGGAIRSVVNRGKEPTTEQIKQMEEFKMKFIKAF